MSWSDVIGKITVRCSYSYSLYHKKWPGWYDISYCVWKESNSNWIWLFIRCNIQWIDISIQWIYIYIPWIEQWIELCIRSNLYLVNWALHSVDLFSYSVSWHLSTSILIQETFLFKKPTTSANILDFLCIINVTKNIIRVDTAIIV